MNYFNKRLGGLLLASAVAFSMIATSPFQQAASAATGKAAENVVLEPLVPLEKGDDLYTNIPMASSTVSGEKRVYGLTESLTGMTATAAPLSTLKNGSFESAAAGVAVADNWTAKAPATGRVELVDSPVDDGVRAQRITGSGLVYLGTVSISQQIAVEPETQYILSGVMNITSLSGAAVQLYVEYYDAVGTVLKSASTTQSSTTDGYQQMSLVRVTPAGAASMKVYVLLRATAAGGSGSFLVDRMELIQTDKTLDNPGFETYTGTSGTADQWQLLVWPGAVPKQAVVTSPVVAGSYAQQVAGSSIPNGKYVIVSQWLAVQPDTSYTMTGQVKVNSLNNAKVQLYLDYYDANENFLGMYWVESAEVTDGYVQLTNEHVTPANTAYTRLYAVLRATADNASGNFDLDQMSVDLTSDLQQPTEPTTPEEPTEPTQPTEPEPTTPADEPVSLIPKQTSASKNVSSREPTLQSEAYNAFDLDPNTSWRTPMPSWLAFDFGTRTNVQQYAIIAPQRVNTAPADWTFEGFDGKKWIVLDRQTNFTNWSPLARTMFSLNTAASYTKYRLSLTDTVKNGTVELQELEMYGNQ